MRKVCLILTGLFLCIGDASAAERGVNTVSRQSTKTDVVSPARSTKRNTVATRTSSREQQAQQTTSRTAKTKTVIGRSAIQKTSPRLLKKQPTRISRAATTTTKTFGTNYNSCRDAYFTCMDQFCATLDDTYRRCVCSSKLDSIKNQEKKLSQTEDSLKDFENLNIDAISKTASEVKSMASA